MAWQIRIRKSSREKPSKRPLLVLVLFLHEV
uniref:Uncharacterized protein n=1 Tax=Rhizophora mucronata TaxID=61149 RepID=A0A2P2L6R7_RHIMU